MKKSIEDLREEVALLEKEQKQEEEYNKLLARKKELEERNTTKAKAKEVFKKVRSHLHEKGKQFKEDGERLKGKDDDGFFKKPDFGTGFGTKKEYIGGDIETPLSKQLKSTGKKK